jgi:2-polyprenyl-3-methyl-5-hydroxy-6-metoxy-1,4-benzoquinol methylase
MRNSQILTSSQNWSGRKSRGEIKSVLFEDIFFKYLNRSEGKSCIEIGCVPGRFLAFISKKFGYFPEGIDYVESTKKITEETLQNNGIKNYRIYKEDFLKWIPLKQYDLVCSFGFIEHFRGNANREMVRKHIDLIKPGGKLIMDIPNFNYCQYLFHFLLNREILRQHNIKIMNLSYFKKIAEDYNLRILHLDYYGGLFGYFGLSDKPNLFQRAFYKLLRLIAKKTKGLAMLNNRFLSPFIIFVSEKE